MCQRPGGELGDHRHQGGDGGAHRLGDQVGGGNLGVDSDVVVPGQAQPEAGCGVGSTAGKATMAPRSS